MDQFDGIIKGEITSLIEPDDLIQPPAAQWLDASAEEFTVPNMDATLEFLARRCARIGTTIWVKTPDQVWQYCRDATAAQTELWLAYRGKHGAVEIVGPEYDEKGVLKQKGTNTGMGKILTDDVVYAVIRELPMMPKVEIAQRHGINVETVRKIQTGKTALHITQGLTWPDDWGAYREEQRRRQQKLNPAAESLRAGAETDRGGCASDPGQ